MSATEKVFLPAKGIFTPGEVQKFGDETSATGNIIHLNNAGCGNHYAA